VVLPKDWVLRNVRRVTRKEVLMFSPKLIVAPIDHSEYSQEALQAAAALAKSYDAEILLVDIVPAIPRLMSAADFFHEAEYEAALRKEAEEGLEKLVEELKQNGNRARVEIGIANDVGNEIIRIAEHNSADLIVIATHGMTGWHKFMVGSVAEDVVRHANCPVLVLRAASKTEPAPQASSAAA
jgi:nucleotide-binding universal stress UspA family protein